MSYDALSLFQNLSAGDRIDVQDQEGDWFETIVRKVIGNKIICHFWGFANIWDCMIEYNPSKIAPVHTYSEISKYKDNEKLLGESVWEILSLKHMLGSSKQCTKEALAQIHSETGISEQAMQSFLDTMDAPDDIQLKLCKYVQKTVIEMGLNLRVQELMENGVDCFGFDAELSNNIQTITSMNNIKEKISQSIHEIENNKKKHLIAHEIKPLNLANLSKIDLPDINDIPNTVNTLSSTTNTDNNSSDSHTNYVDHSNTNIFLKNKFDDNLHCLTPVQSPKIGRKRKQTIPSKKAKKRHKKSSETLIPTMIDHSNGHSKVLVTKYDHKSPKKEWLAIPNKDEMIAGPDGKYRCKSSECTDKPHFKTYTSTVRHIQIEHQSFRYRCDLCREECGTEVEFRSHSTLKIHLANMHKLTKNDFGKVRIILSLAGNDSIVKKTQNCDEYSFKKWKKRVISEDYKRKKVKNGKIRKHKSSRNSLKKMPVFGGGLGRDTRTNLFAMKHINAPLNLGLNLSLDMTATAPKPMGRGKSAGLGSVTSAKKVKTPKSRKKGSDAQKPRKPICPVCGQKFKNFQALGGHKKKHNPNWGKNRRNKFGVFGEKLLDINEIKDEDFDVDMAINTESLPRIKIKMPPPPPPHTHKQNGSSDSESESDYGERRALQMKDGSSSVYKRMEMGSNERMYFESGKKRGNANKSVKRFPFGPMWIPSAESDVFEKKRNSSKRRLQSNSNNRFKSDGSEGNKELKLINVSKTSMSSCFGSVVLHFG